MGARGTKTKEQLQIVENKSKQIGITKEPPAHLSKDAKKIWKDTLAILPHDHIREHEFALFEMYCQDLAKYWQAQREWEDSGGEFVLGNQNGTLQPNPFINIIAKYDSSVKMLATKLRLTPNSRLGSKTVQSRGSKVKSQREGLMYGGQK